jgi:hypothetical protein
MRWRMILEVVGADGTRQVHEVGAGGRSPAGHTAATLGLGLEEGKAVLAAVQRRLVTVQVEEHCRGRRRCDRCGAQRPLKDLRPRRLASLFGVVEVRAPRFGPCRCGVACRRSVSPVAEIMPDRCTPEYERLVAAMGAALPYRRALALLGELFPLGDVPAVETMRRRTLRVGMRLERAALAPSRPPAAAPEAGPIALGIDAGHVRSVRSYQVRSFEVFVAQVSGAEGEPVAFAGVPAEADRQQEQLRRVLLRLGATPGTPVTVLSDGADGPRSLGEAACVGPTSHVLDWFHLAMRIRHAAQTAKGWPAATPADREEGARLADAVERIRWRLWHGQVPRALDLIGQVLSELDAAAETASPTAAGKLAVSLGGLETYVTGQSGLIIDYAKARSDGEPISTATTEGAVQWLLHRRMGASQQMRWSPRGAHRMLTVRTAVANGTLAEDHLAAERWTRRPFRPAA